jgi:hypothetical protein
MPSSSQAERWCCISGCGACCRLDPAQRPEALAALSPSQRQAYLALVANLMALFGAAGDHAETLAIQCCSQQIRSEYGGRSTVMKRFQRAIRQQP